MSKYHLTEAYGNLYNPRKADETFYENLRFVDYLMQEEIEEVMESLLWEFMDYGNTLDESYDLIEGVFSDDVILEEVLTEARMSPQRMAQRAAERKATLKQVEGEKATQRRQARKAAVTGALKKAGETVKGAATGTGSAAMGAMRAGKQAAAGAYERAKGLPGKAMAALKGLVRKGAAYSRMKGSQMQKAGTAQQASGLSSRQAGRKGRGGQYELSFEPSTKERAGGIRKAIGGLLKKAGTKVYRAMSGGKGSSSETTTPKTPSLGLKKLESSGTKPAYNPAAANRSARRRMGRQLNPATPLDKKGKEATSPITRKAQERAQISTARQSLRKEEYELLAQYILEDFINAGYADTYEDAFEILENLSEGSIVELTEMYLEG